MVTQQLVFRGAQPEGGQLGLLTALKPDLLLVFAPAHRLTAALAALLREAAPGALQLGCAAHGEISNEGVAKDAVVITGLRFADPRLIGASTRLEGVADSGAAGRRLAAALVGPGTHTVLVLGQGVRINGSALVHGMQEVLGPKVLITGGLAGDPSARARTPVLYNGVVSDEQIAAVAFCSDRLVATCGSRGGWRSFGPVRRVTRALGSEVFTLDDLPALEIYRRYLGDYANQLPGSALLFPLGVLTETRQDRGLIRTVRGVDEANGSILLAGAVEEGAVVRMMHASANGLIEGAQEAAALARRGGDAEAGGFALLVSCVGRRAVLGPRVEEEVEAVAEVFGPAGQVAGFYSHGEIGPLGTDRADCHLNNQTMTITWFQEL